MIKIKTEVQKKVKKDTKKESAKLKVLFYKQNNLCWDWARKKKKERTNKQY